MLPKLQHDWNLSVSDAYLLQQEWSEKVVKTDILSNINMVAGVDVAYAKNSDRVIAAVVVLDAVSLAVVETAYADEVSSFPYIPGLFSFRELPAIVSAFEKLTIIPDLVVCDGQGLAHPRRFGLACHLGIMFDMPTIGCAKNRLIGTYVDPESSRGSFSSLLSQGDIIGGVLRTQNNTKPVFVSVGHRISLVSALNWIIRLSPNYRLPETTRTADYAVRDYLKHHQIQ